MLLEPMSVVEKGIAQAYECGQQYGPFDLIFECTGFSPVVFDAMQGLGKNGVLVLPSVTGGDRRLDVPADAINLGFVLGNKVIPVDGLESYRMLFDHLTDAREAIKVFGNVASL